MSAKALVVDPFCFRQFSESEASKSYGGSVFSVPIGEFENTANAQYDESKLQDGYAPFCKHIFIPNFTDERVNVLEITEDNERHLRTRYEARSEKELPVLTRYFPRELVASDASPLPVAKYLDLILYSREQINKENEAMGKKVDTETAPWGIVSIKAQNVDHEIPMAPITAMRNALGKEEGGSGVPLDRDAYMAAYEFWNKHANVS
mmetsp:Transcript_57565/g.162352  ORF Transcript_57565/g.162352 Transcript_57565/m.162352 type:complete len:206 (+) Transcript_57565:43-660(+)|eukprot:CAMPEP_0179214124 /NCGR_PEP_ID=MMETSP0797-20121207/2114_1 /TAXON_ID=47934 /ORGANISM="Dinophysis acuminata, Strain DAEP01" /LENGTH=205 /DNA_ID=CAMNT_0020920067 /DNA_START=43 /DNA_END=660 /DNA_ORIENTATION=+